MMKEYITREMIADGLWQELVEPKLNDNGLVCHIGEYWFFFGGTEFEETNPKHMAFDELVEEIICMLDDWFESIEAGYGDEFKDEYKYYYYYLKEGLKYE